MKEIVNLGNLPLVNNLFKNQKNSLIAKKYRLRIVEEENLLMKLDLEIPPKDMFEQYLYRSSVNKPYIEHCKNMWEYLKQFNPKRIIDIGGNDGALLKAFKDVSKSKLHLTNVDASFSFKKDNEKEGIEYIQDYWGDRIFKNKFDLITSTNVFQHNPNYEKFLNGVSSNLDGIWLLEFPYFLETVRTNQFDQIYHEHVFYWMLTPLYYAFKKYNLKIIDVSIENIHGGSMRIVSSNRAEHKENSEKIKFFIEQESKFNFSNWGNKIKDKLISDNNFVNSLNGSVAAFGAAAKGCVYLNCLGSKKIKYIIDDTKEKQNMFSPGTGLKIYNREILKNDTPDNIIILAHNFKNYIAKSLRKDNYKGKIFVMLPEIEEL